MGVFNKLKNIFYDEEEEVIEPKEVKREIKKEPIVFNEPKKEEEVKIVRDEVVKDAKSENTYTERELFRSERTFNFTEFDDVEEVVAPPRKNVLDIEKRTSRIETPTIEYQKPKIFKPSTVISPIYDILNKDYTKEEMERSNRKDSNPITYDTVRKKAFKNYNDEVEEAIDVTTMKVKRTMDDVESEIKKLNEKTTKIEDLISKIENTNSSVTVGEVEDLAKNEIIENEDIEDIEDTITDDTLEHDLFNLIDSMYDDKEE